MPFKKGQKANPNGRPKGTSNKVTKASRELLNDILNGEVDNIQDSLEKVRNDDHFKYLTILERLLSYVMPKKKDITSDDKELGTTIVIKEITKK